MFPSRYFPDRYFAPRYWPKVGADPVGQSGSVVGIWSKITYLEARNQTPELEARSERLILEGRNANME